MRETASQEAEQISQALPTIPWPVRTHPTKILAGAGSINGIVEELDFLEVDKALIVSGPNAAKRPTFARVVELLGERCAGTYTNAQMHTPRSTVYELNDVVDSTGAETLIAIGGGSTSDLCKAVSTMRGEGKPIEQLHSEYTPETGYQEQFLKKPKMPHISIPTTLSGADVAAGFGVMGPDHLKRICRGDYIPARIVFLDPEVTLDTDLDVFLHTGMNGLAHGIEALYSRTREPLSTAMALESIRLFLMYLPEAKARPDDLEVRLQLLWANLLGGMLLSNARMGIHHGVSHVLGGNLGFTHGFSNALMLPYTLRFNRDYVAPYLARGAAAVGVRTPEMNDVEAAQALIDKVFEVRAAIGIPRTLRDLPDPPSDEDLRELAETAFAFERTVFFNPRPIRSANDIYYLFQLAAGAAA
jgi:alcohol dehydrogenase class IV